MAISSAFAISRSGLASVEKWSEITSANIANGDRVGVVCFHLKLRL